MKYLSAQYVITNSGPPLKRGIVTIDEGGTIIRAEDTAGNLTEKARIEFFNGIIIPGFVNCHCHLELSHLKGLIPHHKGLPEFIKLIRSSRDAFPALMNSSIESADNEMYYEGIVLCADTCNTAATFNKKKNSLVRYINLLEVFGIDPGKAAGRLNEIVKLAEIAGSMDINHSIVPHSAYALSLTLFRMLYPMTTSNRITSIHFMETMAEKEYLADLKGPLKDSYTVSGLLSGKTEAVKDHATAVLDEITSSGNLILVHNTYVDKTIIEAVMKRKDLFWCLCPNSNLYIENQLPPVNLLMEMNCSMVTGTDSLASNHRLSILEEIRTLQDSFPHIPLEMLVRWATYNGAKALGQEMKFGSIEPGKEPGLLLIRDADLQKMRLLPESKIIRLI